MPGTFSPPSGTSDPDMHHGTCVTHVPWCMPGSLTSVFLWSQWRGKTLPAFPAHAQPAILRIWQEAHRDEGVNCSEWFTCRLMCNMICIQIGGFLIPLSWYPIVSSTHSFCVTFDYICRVCRCSKILCATMVHIGCHVTLMWLKFAVYIHAMEGNDSHLCKLVFLQYI